MAGMFGDEGDRLERLALLPHPRGMLVSEGRGSVMSPGINFTNWIAPQWLAAMMLGLQTPRAAYQGEEMDPRDALNVAGVAMGGGLLTGRSAVGLRGNAPISGKPIRFDPKEGVGAVPWNQDIAYRGFTREITPREFLKLAAYISPHKINQKAMSFLRSAIEKGKPLGVPFLEVRWNSPSKSWHVVSHEGRHRATLLAEIDPNTKIPVHLFPQEGLRARDLTPEMVSAPLIDEDTVRVNILLAEAKKLQEK